MKPWLPLSIRTPDGEVVGHCTLFDENLIDVLDLGDVLLRLPLCLAGLLEAAGPWRWKGRGDSGGAGELRFLGFALFSAGGEGIGIRDIASQERIP